MKPPVFEYERPPNLRAALDALSKHGGKAKLLAGGHSLIPLLNLRLFKGRNFGIGVFVNVLMGFALFGTVYLLPQYLGQVQRYNAEQIGNVLAWTGLPQLLLIPLVPLLMTRVDARYIGALGLGLVFYVVQLVTEREAMRTEPGQELDNG